MNFKILFRLTAILLPLCAVLPLHAQHMNATNAPCKTVGTGVDQANCLSIAAKKADDDLNATYQRIIAILAAGDRQKLQSAEYTWLLYREQTCAAERDLYEGGSGGLTTYPACLEAVTRYRIGDLKAAYWWKVEKFGS